MRIIPVGPGYATHEDHGRLSPYDIPGEAKVSYDKSAKRFRIKFEYLTPDEPRKSNKISDGVSVETGKHTGKLYIIDAEEEALEGITSALETEISKYDPKVPKYRVPYLNFSLARDFLESKEGELRAPEQ